jgi:hypothetical protein
VLRCRERLLQGETGRAREAGGQLQIWHERAWVGRSERPLWADALETLVMLGELDCARAHIKRHEERAKAIVSPWAIASAPGAGTCSPP